MWNGWNRGVKSQNVGNGHLPNPLTSVERCSYTPRTLETPRWHLIRRGGQRFCSDAFENNSQEECSLSRTIHKREKRSTETNGQQRSKQAKEFGWQQYTKWAVVVHSRWPRIWHNILPLGWGSSLGEGIQTGCIYTLFPRYSRNEQCSMQIEIQFSLFAISHWPIPRSDHRRFSGTTLESLDGTKMQVLGYTWSSFVYEFYGCMAGSVIRIWERKQKQQAAKWRRVPRILSHLFYASLVFNWSIYWTTEESFKLAKLLSRPQSHEA